MLFEGSGVMHHVLKLLYFDEILSLVVLSCLDVVKRRYSFYFVFD